MNLLYGVVGEGMGHATRSRVVLEHLLARGHRIKVVVSNRAFKFLSSRFAGRENIEVIEIAGLHLVYEDNEVQRRRSLLSNLRQARAGIRANTTAYARMIEAFHPQAVISDFESWAWAYGRRHGVPVVSIDNMTVIHRCAHAPEILKNAGPDYAIAKWAVKAKMGGAWHYLVSSFFFPPVRKPRTTLVSPILRPEVLAARREPGAHVLVYQTSSANAPLLEVLRKLPFEFRIYGMGREGAEGNLHFRAFSETGFVDDLRTARGVVAGGGYSLMGEAVHLRVPMLSVPIEGQFEQELNARYLEDLGYGRRAEVLDEASVVGFLDGLDAHQQALTGYTPRDNSMLFGCLDEVLARIDNGEKPPARLMAENLGAWRR